MAASSPRLETAPSRVVPPSKETHQRTVLMIGNTEENYDILKPIVESLGSRVVIVPTHGRALEFLFEHCPTLLLIDTTVTGRMPLAHFIATVRSRYPNLRIGLTGNQATEADLQLGDFRLAEPLVMDEVISALEKWAARKPVSSGANSARRH